MLKTYSSKGGTIMATDQYSIDKRAFPFKDETSIDATVKQARYELIPNRRALPAANTVGQIEFLIDPTTDGSMWDLHNSYMVLDVIIGNEASNYGMSQFASNQIVTDCDIILGSEYVNDKHVNLYPYSAFVKDVLYRKRPPIPSTTLNLTSADGAATVTAANGAANSGMSIVGEDVLEEGNYLSHPLFTMATAAGRAGQQSSLAFTKLYMNNTTIPVKVVLKDTIFMTSKYWPSDNKLTIRPTIDINKLNQVVGGVNPGMTISSANFYLKRVFLTESASDAFNVAIRSSQLCYNLPYSRIATFQIPAGVTSFNPTQVFNDNFRPDLVCLYTVLNANNTTLPLTACAPLGYNAVAATGLYLNDAYIQMDGQYFPERTAGDNYLATQTITSYKEYVKNCLIEPEDEVFLDWLHWANHYGVTCINTRLDKAKWYTQAPTESNGGFNLYLNIAGGQGAATLYVVAFNNVKLTIDSSGQIHKHGF